MHLRAARTQRPDRRRDQGAAAADRDLLRGARREHRLPDRPAGARRGADDMSAFVYDAVRTPFGRFGGGLARRPSRRPGGDRARRPGARRTSRPGARRGRARQRQRRRRGQPQRRPDGRCCWPGSRSPCRARRSTGSAAPASTRRWSASRTIETGDADGRARRRRRVDDPGAVGAAQARHAPSRPATSPRSRPRWAGGWSTRAMPAEWTVSLGEANEQLQQEFGISRERQDEFAARSHRLAARGLGGRVLRRPGHAGPGSRPGARRGHPPRLDRRDPGRAEAVVPPGRHDHRRQRLAAQRRRVGRAARLGGGRRPARPRPARAASPAEARPPWSRSGSATRRSRPPTAP